jgi:hypothetical protein
MHDFQISVSHFYKSTAVPKAGASCRTIANVAFQFTPDPGIPLVLEDTPYIPKGKTDKVYPVAAKLVCVNRVLIERATVLESLDPVKAARGMFMVTAGLKIPLEVSQFVLAEVLSRLEALAAAAPAPGPVAGVSGRPAAPGVGSEVPGKVRKAAGAYGA